MDYRQISRQGRALKVAEILQRLPRVDKQYPSQPNDESSDTWDATNIIIVTFLGGAALSIILVIVLTPEKTPATHTSTNAYSAGNAKRVHEETTFTEDKYKDDFDYPYEDIGKVTGL